MVNIIYLGSATPNVASRVMFCGLYPIVGWRGLEPTAHDTLVTRSPTVCMTGWCWTTTTAVANFLLLLADLATTTSQRLRCMLFSTIGRVTVVRSVWRPLTPHSSGLPSTNIRPLKPGDLNDTSMESSLQETLTEIHHQERFSFKILSSITNSFLTVSSVDNVVMIWEQRRKNNEAIRVIFNRWNYWKKQLEKCKRSRAPTTLIVGEPKIQVFRFVQTF